MDIAKIYNRKFYSDGYVIIKDFLNNNEVKNFENFLLNVYSKQLKINLNKKNIHSIIKKYEEDEMYDQLYAALKKFGKTKPFSDVSKKFIKLCKLIFNKHYKLIGAGMAIGINGSKRTAYEWHQEKPYYKSLSTMHFQFPILNSCNKKNGTMSVLVGSNKLGFIKKVNNKKLSKKSINSFIPKNINKIKKQFSEKFINMNLKDIVIFSENILHKTNKNISNQVRFAGIVRLKKKD